MVTPDGGPGLLRAGQAWPGWTGPTVAIAPFLEAVRLVFAVSAVIVALAIIPAAIGGDPRPAAFRGHRRGPVPTRIA